MGKQADIYFRQDPWCIIEEGLDPAYNQLAESIFSLGNELMGVRGYFEEGLPKGTPMPSLLGSYFGGIYEWAGPENGGGYKGIVTRTHYMVCAADWLYCPIIINGQTLDMTGPGIRDFRRVLDMRSGLLTRSFVWLLQDGTEIACTFERLLCMDDPHRAGQRIIFKGIHGNASIQAFPGIDGSVIHHMVGRCDWQEAGHRIKNNLLVHRYATKTSGQQVSCAFKLIAPDGASVTSYEKGLCSGFEVCFDVAPGEEKTIEKQIYNAAERDQKDTSEGKTLEEMLAIIDKNFSFDENMAQNTSHYQKFWHENDVEIEGDLLNQQGIRFCLFQLHQTYRGYDHRDNIGAKGLTGEAYNGHAFWDTETYCLPYYLLHDINAAKKLLMFRYYTLPQARDRAKALDCRGACYPIATLNGYEACTLWQHASLQMQPSTAVAYGIWNYYHMTKDNEFLFNQGIEMLIEISRYCASRGDWNQNKSAYGYYGVMGPDEFHMMVNHNYYTNLMGKKTIAFTLKTLSALKENDAKKYKALCERLGLIQSEVQAWEACAAGMSILQNKELIFEQHEGYFSLPHINIKQIPITDFPLYHHWSYDRIYRTDMIKQPDVLMAMFLYPNDYSLKEKQANYDYYEPRCIHESSLSPSIHAIIANELGRHEEAFKFFGFATRMDLDNYNRNTSEGLHTTSIAAAWVTIVFGFGGLRTDGDYVSIAPSLPAQWQAYSFAIKIKAQTLHIKVMKEGVRITKDGEGSAELDCYGQHIVIDSGKDLFINIKANQEALSE